MNKEKTTLLEFKQLIASIPEEFDNYAVCIDSANLSGLTLMHEYSSLSICANPMFRGSCKVRLHEIVPGSCEDTVFK